MNTDWNNISPRFGFAWQATQGRHTTAVRGGYGVFFVRPFPRLYNNFVESAPFTWPETTKLVSESARIE